MKEDRNDRAAGQGLTVDSTEALREHLRASAREALKEIFEQEIRSLCGERYHPEGVDCRRAGTAPSYVITDARREPMARPRVRRGRPDGGAEEVQLESWKLAQSPDEWEAAMMRAVLCGVSTRGCKRLRPDELAGESRSSISRLWQRKAAGLVERVQQSDLSGIDLVALILDGVVLGKQAVATVALGIGTDGTKQVLGFRVGSSENREVCRDLLGNLSRRGLRAPAKRYLLAVLDGSQALDKALSEVFPRTLVQRCLVHKERNLKGYLSHRHWPEINRLFKRLRKCQGTEAAGEALADIDAFLADKNRQARESLEEARGELVTLLELDVPNTLNRSLLSTNCIENLFKNLRRHIGRVCRWREETDQAERWLASGLVLASEGFRKISGHREIPALVAALERRMAEDEKSRKEAA
jgi:transposase-like protein